MEKIKLIGLENLPDNFRIGLDDKFRTDLFRKADERLHKIVLASESICHANKISELKGRFIKIGRLKKLAQITNTPLENIEMHATEIRSRDNNRKIKIKFPIFATPKLASVIGHCMGDGSLSSRQFSFFNKSRELVDEVINNVQVAFSTHVKPVEFTKCGGWEIEFPTNIGRLIAFCGGPLGKKVFLPFRVPLWIMNGTSEIKASFLRALFDDEGWVKIKINHRTKTVRRMIGINMSKNSKFDTQHKEFFEDIRKLLLDLGIESSNVVRMGKTKNGNCYGIIISNFINLAKFFNIIGFSSKNKNQKLLEILTNSKRFNFVPMHQNFLL